MDRIYLFLIRNDVWIYIVSALGLFWYITEFIRAQGALRRAVFNLERETATRVRNHALSFILFFGAVVGIVYYVNRNIAPELPATLLLPPTPTPDIFATPLASPTPLATAAAEGEAPGQPILAPTVTLPALPGLTTPIPITGTLTVEATVAAAPTPFESCIPELTITEPLNGSVVFQRVRFRGTANTGELHQYTIELNGPQTGGQWAPIFQEPAPQPVINGDLGEADLSTWQAGPYRVQMRAFDVGGGELGVCTIQFILDS